MRPELRSSAEIELTHPFQTGLAAGIGLAREDADRLVAIALAGADTTLSAFASYGPLAAPAIVEAVAIDERAPWRLRLTTDGTTLSWEDEGGVNPVARTITSEPLADVLPPGPTTFYLQRVYGTAAGGGEADAIGVEISPTAR